MFWGECNKIMEAESWPGRAQQLLLLTYLIQLFWCRPAPFPSVLVSFLLLRKNQTKTKCFDQKRLMGGKCLFHLTTSRSQSI